MPQIDAAAADALARVDARFDVGRVYCFEPRVAPFLDGLIALGLDAAAEAARGAAQHRSAFVLGQIDACELVRDVLQVSRRLAFISRAGEALLLQKSSFVRQGSRDTDEINQQCA